MPQITFKGKTYNSEFEMPQDVRQAYQQDQMRKNSMKPLSDVVDMPAEVEDVYRRALGREAQSISSPSSKDLPTTEELYRQSAPSDMKHLPSDESVYRPSAPVIDPEHGNIEPESGLVARGLAIGFLWALVVAVLVFLVIQFLL